MTPEGRRSFFFFQSFNPPYLKPIFPDVEQSLQRPPYPDDPIGLGGVSPTRGFLFTFPATCPSYEAFRLASLEVFLVSPYAPAGGSSV